MNRNDETNTLPPVDSTIDGLKVKENVNANLNLKVAPSASQPAAEVKTLDTSLPKQSPAKRPVGNRCFECRKKVPISALSCKCGHTFCSSHRMAEEHKCTYDYKTNQRQQLKENLVQVVSSKVAKI